MARRIKSKFALDVFDGKLTSRKALIRYIDIYLENISPENRTNTNEMIAFLEEPLPDRRIIYFGLSHADVPCGFAMFILYPTDRAAVVDHLAIDVRVRGVGAFFEFVDLISEYLSENLIFPDYVLVEIMRRSQSLQGDVNPGSLIRLLRVIGFRVVQIPYIAPHTGIIRNPDEYRSALMVVSRQHQSELSREECTRLIELMYYTHYLSWYQKAWDARRVAPYEYALEKCFKRLSERLEKVDFVRLNGAASPPEDGFMRTGIAQHASNYARAAILFAPIALTIVISLTQELWLTASVIAVTLFGLILVFSVPSLRTKFMRIFGLE
jgi:hypothetical protein